MSDDNPYSEVLFRTAKYRPEYPSKPFESLETARRWVAWFVAWYNTEHLHSAIRYVTPEQRTASPRGGPRGPRPPPRGVRDGATAPSGTLDGSVAELRNWDPIDVVRVRLNADPPAIAKSA